MRPAMFPPLRYCAEHHDFELGPMSRELPPLTYLGRSTSAPKTPDEAILDRVPNPYDKGPMSSGSPRRNLRSCAQSRDNRTSLIS